MNRAYIRVSTQEQGKEGMSLQVQEHRIRQHRGSESIKFYCDVASARTRDRHNLQQLLGDLKAGDRVLVFRLDRISRSVCDLANLIREFEERKVSFVSCQEVFDTESASGKAFLNMLGVFAQFESDVISERTVAALAESRKAGNYQGTTPFGYRRAKKRLVPYIPQQRVIKQMKRMRAQGMIYRSIAEYLNQHGIPPMRGKEWYGPVVNDMLKREARLATSNVGKNKREEIMANVARSKAAANMAGMHRAEGDLNPFPPEKAAARTAFTLLLIGYTADDLVAEATKEFELKGIEESPRAVIGAVMKDLGKEDKLKNWALAKDGVDGKIRVIRKNEPEGRNQEGEMAAEGTKKQGEKGVTAKRAGEKKPPQEAAPIVQRCKAEDNPYKPGFGAYVVFEILRRGGKYNELLARVKQEFKVQRITSSPKGRLDRLISRAGKPGDKLIPFKISKIENGKIQMVKK